MVITRNCITAKQHLISGRFGVGKTATAKQIERKFCQQIQANEEFKCVELDCSSIPRLYECFHQESRRLGLGLENHFNTSRGNVNSLISGLDKLFRKMCEKYDGQYILFRLYDAEFETKIVRAIDESICKLVTAVPGNPLYNYARVKVLIETEEVNAEKWVQACHRLDQKHFYRIEGFSLEETTTFLRSVNGLSPADIEKLQDLIGGHPATLKQAREELINNKVQLHRTLLCMQTTALSHVRPLFLSKNINSLCFCSPWVCAQPRRKCPHDKVGNMVTTLFFFHFYGSLALIQNHNLNT